MKRWGRWIPFLSKAGIGSPSGPGSEVIAQVHYRSRSDPDLIRSFKVGDGSSFLLTFHRGGTVPINLIHVKEIEFGTLVHDLKPHRSEFPTYQVKVSLTNGRVLEGYSDGLYSFSGLREGTAWTYSCRGGFAEQIEARDSLARIVVREMRQP